MQKRRRLLLALSALPLGAFAQQRKIPVIGYMSPVVPQNGTDWRLDAFVQGMKDLGYVDGQNMRLVVRWGEGRLERMPAIAQELVKMKVDIIVASSSPSVLAARDATRTIPIVMPVSSDPVGDGIVKSLAHPGGNITGLSLMAPELGAKRLQILKDVLKKSQKVVVMWNPAYTGMRARFKDTEKAAPGIGMSVHSLEVSDPRQMEAAFDAVKRDKPDGLVLLADPLTNSMRARIVEFARENNLPAIYETREFVEAGGLISYGASVSALTRRSAYYVDRILKGAKPGDLPIEQPANIELFVNLRTAKELRVTIPKSILATADQVIQ